MQSLKELKVQYITKFWQLHSARPTSAAKGLMGACPHMRSFYPD